MEDILISHMTVKKKFFRCEDCKKLPPMIQVAGRIENSVLVLTRNYKVVGYKCSRCRGRINENANNS